MLFNLMRRFSFERRLPADFRRVRVRVSAGADSRFVRGSINRAGGDLFAVARCFIRPGASVWDIGSNVGLFTMTSAVRAGRAGYVLAIDADPFHTGLLTRSIRNLNPACDASVQALCLAIAEGPAIVDLVLSNHASAKNHLASGPPSDGLAQVRRSCYAVTLDGLLKVSRPPDFVKIDVEGAEERVLRGATKVLSEVRPSIYIEVSKKNQSIVTDTLAHAGYKLYELRRGCLEPLEQCAFNTLAIPTEKVGDVQAERGK